MQLKAKLIQILPLQTGMGKNGQLRKQDIIVETDEQYPKKIAVSIWGDKIDEKQLVINRELAITFDIESREFNNKWYTDIRATKIETEDAKLVENLKQEFETKTNFEEPLEEDDLPF